MLIAGCTAEGRSKTLLAREPASITTSQCDIEIVVLGTGQDAGAPQIGYNNDPAWSDRSLRQTATSIALVDRTSPATFLFDAAPHLAEQLQLLNATANLSEKNLGLSGVFITHAHIGHYAGLMFLGHEAAGTSKVPVYAMPRMREFLSTNGPWEQLVQFDNIVLEDLSDKETVELSDRVAVTPYRVPHRDEYSETVGFVIEVENAHALYLPDIDSWTQWESEFGIRIQDMVESVDLVFIDATFYSDDELPGRDMSKIPHPRVAATMDLLARLTAREKSRVNFIHYNHTNPIRFADSEQTRAVLARGFNVARAGDRHCLTGD